MKLARDRPQGQPVAAPLDRYDRQQLIVLRLGHRLRHGLVAADVDDTQRRITPAEARASRHASADMGARILRSRRNARGRDELLLVVKVEERRDVVPVVGVRLLRDRRRLDPRVPKLKGARRQMSHIVTRSRSSSRTLITPSSSPVARHWFVRCEIRLIGTLRGRERGVASRGGGRSAHDDRTEPTLQRHNALVRFRYRADDAARLGVEHAATGRSR